MITTCSLWSGEDSPCTVMKGNIEIERTVLAVGCSVLLAAVQLVTFMIKAMSAHCMEENFKWNTASYIGSFQRFRDLSGYALTTHLTVLSLQTIITGRLLTTALFAVHRSCFVSWSPGPRITSGCEMYSINWRTASSRSLARGVVAETGR